MDGGARHRSNITASTIRICTWARREDDGRDSRNVRGSFAAVGKVNGYYRMEKIYGRDDFKGGSQDAK